MQTHHNTNFYRVIPLELVEIYPNITQITQLFMDITNIYFGIIFSRKFFSSSKKNFFLPPKKILFRGFPQKKKFFYLKKKFFFEEVFFGGVELFFILPQKKIFGRFLPQTYFFILYRSVIPWYFHCKVIRVFVCLYDFNKNEWFRINVKHRYIDICLYIIKFSGFYRE